MMTNDSAVRDSRTARVGWQWVTVAAIICVLACVPAPAHAETIDMCDYYPLAVGNLWRADMSGPFIGEIKVTGRHVVNGFDVWEVSYERRLGSTVLVSWVEYQVWIGGILYSAQDLQTLAALPGTSDEMPIVFARYYSVGVPVTTPDGETATADRGPFSSLLQDPDGCVGIGAYGAGDQTDAVVLVGSTSTRFFVLGTGLAIECIPSVIPDPAWDYFVPVTPILNEGCPNPLFLTSTNLGEVWEAGTVQTVTWQRDTEVAGPDIRIGLHKGAAFIEWIVRQTPNDGEYTWLIPPDLAPGDDYRLRIQSFTDSTIRDYSDDTFSITPPALALTVPNGGEALQAVNIQTIGWLGDDPAVGPDVRLGLHRGATFVGWITRRTSNDGEFNWLIPDDLPAAANYRLRVQSFTDSAIRDFSDRRFAIVR